MNRLIDYAYLKQETDIPSEVDYKLLDNPIKWAQDQLSFVLGRALYNEIYTQATTTPTSFSVANAALFDPYIKQFLAWTACHDYRRKSGFYNSRTGPRVWKEENSDPADDGTMNMLVKIDADKVQFYKGNMINYILDQQYANSSAFPFFKCRDRMGSGFGITGVTKKPTEFKKITKRIIQNGY